MHQTSTAPKSIIPRAVLTAAGVLAAAALVMALADRPAFAQGPYEVEYPENGRGAVAVFTAQDPEGDLITWTIGGTDAEKLSLSSTGVLSFKSRPDFEAPVDDEANNTYLVTVSAADTAGSNTTLTASVTVTVTNIEEAGVATLPRVPRQEVALQATLTDPDKITAGTTTWQWAWSTSSSSSGTWTNIPGATADSYEPTAADVGRYLRATATYDDGHGDGKVARVISAAAVATKLYSAPEFDSTTTRRIAEDASAGDAVGAPVVARHNANDVLTYTMTLGDNTPADYFTINRSTGQISVGSAAVLDHDGDTPSYTVTVTAADPASKSASTTVTIQVTNVDEPPRNIASSTTNTTDFTGCSGTTIKYLREGDSETTALCTYTATDPEGNQHLEWSLAGADAADFHISNEIGSAGQLSFRSVPDYESPDDSGTDNTYNVTVRASDRTGNVASLNLIVGVDNHEETGEVTFGRLQPAVGVKFTAKVVDPDGRATRPTDDNLTSDATWTWGRCDTSGASECDAITGATSATYTPTSDDFDKYLEARASYLDAESGTTPRTVRRTVPYAVLAADADNTRPAFASRSHTFTIPENTTSGTAVGTAVAATDGDAPTQRLTYALSGSNASSFRINAAKGQISVGPDAVLNYESGRRSYSLSVQATDPFGLTASAARVTINVTNQAEKPVFDDPDTLVYYKERGQDPVATYDADDPERSTVIWSLGGTNATAFEITQRGVLSFRSPPSYSCTTENNRYSVTIKASDGLLTTDQAVTVRVENIEDSGVVGLSSLLPQEGIALTATLTDPDGGYGACSTTALAVLDPDTADHAESQVKWQWARSTNGRTWVNIVEDNPDRKYTPVEEDVGKFLRATASYRDYLSSDYEIKTASQISANKVRIRRYTAPVFEDSEGKTLANTTRTVTENAAAGSAVGAPVAATHNAGQVLTYALATGVDAESFTIDSGTGQIRVASGASIDHETKDTYTVTVEARDADPTATTIGVTITVIDVNEHPAVIIGDSAVNVAENTAASDNVHEYRIRTEQEDTQNDIKWTLSGADADEFTIGSDGSLKFEESPNYEAPTDAGRNNRYNVKVEATDAEGKNAYLAVTVTVTNVQEAGAVTLSTVQPEVGASLSASLADPDGVISGTTTWQWSKTTSLQTECPSDALTHDQSGWTDIASATSARYTPIAADATSCLRVVATYRDRLASGRKVSSLSSVFPVQARDTSNQPPVFPNQNAAQTITVAENTTTALSPRVKANDEGDQDNLTYTLSGTDAASFSIVRGNAADVTDKAGELSPASGTVLDYESKPTYRVTVKATDPSGRSASVAVTIKVTDVNEAPTLTLDSFVVSGASVVDYPETGSGPVGTYTAAGTKATGIRWSLSGTDSGDFRISNAGVLTFASQPNFESPADSNRDNVYEVTVRARNSSGNFALRSVTVSVGNVDEPGRVSLSRTSASVGTALTASLTDGDGGVSTIAWQWSRSLDGATRFTVIAGATSATYTPVQDDVGKYLRATASYPDDQGTGKSASTVTASPVTSLPDSDGRVTLSASRPAVGTAVTATLTDPNTPISNVTWQWSRAATTAGPWIDVPGAVAASYTPVANDTGRYLRAEATYDDSRGFGRTASAVTSSAVTTLTDTAGTVALSSAQPAAGTALTATLTDPDTPISNLSWQWFAAATSTGPWATIVGASSASYTPVDADIGRYLRAQASYDDARGDDKTASATSSNAVQRVQTLQERYDANGNGQIDRSEAIQAINDYLIAGTLTRAETLEVIRLYLIG